MRRALGRFASACLVSLVLALCFSTSALAGVTQSAVYCGDPVDNPDCETTEVWAFSGLRALAAEHSLTETGPFVWFANTRAGIGHPVAGTAVGGGGQSVAREINTVYTDPAGDMSQQIYGMAYDSTSNSLFFADSGNNRIVVFQRGAFGSEMDLPVDYAHPGCFPSDCSTSSGTDNAHLDAPRGLDFDSTRNILWVVDADNLRVQALSYTAGVPESVNPQLAYSHSITMPDWTDTSVGPRSVGVDQHSGRVYVAAANHAVLQVFDAAGTYVRDLDGGGSGVYNSVSVDSLNGIVYASRGDRIDAWSETTGRYLGNFAGENFLHTESIAIAEIESDAASHALYVMTDINFDDGNNPPAVGYTLDDAPACVAAAPVNVNVGQTVQLPINCTDADGDTVELHRTPNQPALGTLTPNADRTALLFTAGGAAGVTTADYTALSKHGRSGTNSQTVNVIAPKSSNAPVVRESANLQLESGDVYVKLPGSDEYVKLTADMLIPIGTVIDARAGKAHLTFANADGSTYDGIFWEGIFQVLQGSGNKPITTMKLRDDLVPKANASIAAMSISSGDPFEGARVAKKRGKKKNGLWGNAKGKYKTSGRGGSAAVRGTIWYVANYQYGTLFKVKRGSVTIDPIRGRNFVLKAGKQFFIFYKK